MTTISEDVLLQVPNVKHKKGEGTLYVMSERIAFILENSETISVSHMYTDIKTQKISSEFKSKVQLQLVFHDGTTSTFQFIKTDRAEAVRDRDTLKEMLFRILPKFQKKVNKELEEKNRMLSENPSLLQLYRDLVITQVITAEEFWKQHAPQRVLLKSGGSAADNNHQSLGVPADFLVDIKPQSDGCNLVKYNLNYDTIQCIFKTYPIVRKKHAEYVPHKLSESDFWKKFFESHYVHKDRMITKDLFGDCALQDELDLKKDVAKTANGPLSLSAAVDDDSTLKNGYGVSLADDDCPADTANKTLIKRFNQHSMNVLKTCKHSKSRTSNNNNNNNNHNHKSDSNCNNNNNHNNNSVRIVVDLPNGNCDDKTAAENNGVKRRKLKIVDSLLSGEEFNDDQSVNDNSAENSSSSVVVVDVINSKLSNVEYWPALANDSSSSSSKTDKAENLSARLDKLNSQREQLIADVQKWSKRHTIFPIHPTAAVNALGDLTPRNASLKNMATDSHKSLLQPIPADVGDELQNLYMAFGELLRRFWSCLPPTTPNLEEELMHTYDAIRKLHTAKLKPFEDKIRIGNSQLTQISSHLNLMLTTAYDKYATWQCRMK